MKKAISLILVVLLCFGVIIPNTIPVVNAESGTNLIEDPSLEEGSALFYNFGDSVIVENADNAHSGNYSVRMGKENESVGGAAQVSTRSMIPGKTYKASVWAKTVDGTAAMGVFCYDATSVNKSPFGGGILLSVTGQSGQSTSSSSYEELSITFTVPEDTVEVGLAVWKSGIIGFAYFDDFSLVELEVVTDYYVATDGNDDNSGSITKPFASIEKARDVIREVKRYVDLPPGQITVNIRGGAYPVTKTINWAAADSGTEENPIVYKAYNNEKVTFMGGKIISGSEAVPVTDENILNRILDPLARQRVMQVDLGALGIEDIPNIVDHGYSAGDDYMPLDVYVDGEALTLARWPNKEPDDAYIKINRKISDTSSSFSFGYNDPTKHTEKWDPSKLEDLHIKGYIGNDWAGASHKIASINVANKTLTSAGRAPWGITLGQKFFFYNLIEEIDVPGESYIDRQNKILYFYPRGNIDNAIITVSTLGEVMFALNEVENANFEGLNFDTTRNVMLQVRDGKNVIIDGCVFARGSRYAVDLDGENCILRNNHIYDMARGGVFVSGGNWLELIPGENLIENNRIHSFNRHYNSSIPAIQIDGNKHTIRNNEIYDSTDMSILLSTGVDHVVEYNEIYNGVQQASDMGAIYWGRRPLQMGYVIRYNYFHDIGNNYDGIGQQSVFYDDGAIGPEMYGNIFYRGTRPLDQGGTVDNSVAFKGHGSQYALIKNNIFIDVPAAGRFMNWSSDGVKSDYWWLWAMDRWSNLQHDVWNNISSVLGNQKWVEYFENTENKLGIRPNLPEIFTPVHYNYVRSKDPFANRDELIAYAKLHAPDNEIEFSNNVLIDVALGNNDPSNPAFWGYANNGPNYRSLEDPGFVEYGKDFKLTEAGLAKIRQTLPDFQNIPTEEIGLLSAIGGYEPSVFSLNIQGMFDIGEIISANYTFDDPDGDREGPSDINWYVANEEDGEYERIPNKKGKELLLDVDCGGRYVRFGIAPYDTNLRYGQEVMSEPVYINVMEGENLIEDPSLEVGSALFYNFENSQIVQDVGNAHSGEYAIRMGSDSESAGGVAQVSTQSMTPGKTYKASLWGKTATGFASMSVVCYDSTSVNKSPFGEGVILSVGADGQSFTSSYEKIGIIFTVPEGTVEVGLAVYKHGSIGFAYFDDFSLAEVVTDPGEDPEPEPPLPINLIEDASLEEGSALFYNFDFSQIVQDVGNSHSGEYAVRMGKETESAGGVAQVSTRSMIPGKTYKASVWAKTVGGTASMGVFCYDATSVNKSPFGGGILLSVTGQSGQSTSSSSYEELSITFTVPEDTVEVGLAVWKSGIIGFAYFDDFSLVEVATDPGEDPPVNLFPNPGVENDSDWENLWESIRLNDPNHAHSGNYSLRVGKAGGTGRAAMFEYDNFIPGATYTASVWGKSDSVNSATLRVTCQDSGLNIILNEMADDYFSSSYENKSVTFTVPEDTFVIGVLVSKESGASGFAYFDDFSLVKVEPEP